MQPTLFGMNDLLACVHVDDVLLVGSREASLRFIKHLKDQNWKLEVVWEDWRRVFPSQEEVSADGRWTGRETGS